MSEVMIPMGSFAAYASTDLAEGRLFKWSTTAEEVTYTGAGERPVGVIIDPVLAGEVLSEKGAAEWFKSAGIVKVPVAFEAQPGDEVASGADGTIVKYSTGYAFGQILTAASTGEEAEIYIYPEFPR